MGYCIPKHPKVMCSYILNGMTNTWKRPLIQYEIQGKECCCALGLHKSKKQSPHTFKGWKLFYALERSHTILFNYSSLKEEREEKKSFGSFTSMWMWARSPSNLLIMASLPHLTCYLYKIFETIPNFKQCIPNSIEFGAPMTTCCDNSTSIIP